MEVPRLEVLSELSLPAYIIATAMWDPSRVFNLHHSSQQCQILNPLSGARDRTHYLMVPSWIHYPLSHDRNSNPEILMTADRILSMVYISKKQQFSFFFSELVKINSLRYSTII